MLESGEHSGTGDTSGRTGRLGVTGGLAPPSPPQPPQKIRGALAPVPQGGNRGLRSNWSSRVHAGARWRLTQGEGRPYDRGNRARDREPTEHTAALKPRRGRPTRTARRAPKTGASGLRNCEPIHFSCLRGLRLWGFVSAALGG